MSKSGIPSPARSQGTAAPHRHKPRRALSVASPRSDTSGKLVSLVEPYINSEKFALSPMKRRSVLPDDTDIEAPRRASWWKRLEGSSRDVLEALDTNKMQDNLVLEEFEVELEKEKQSQSAPEISDNDSVASILVPQRKLFNQKKQPQGKFNEVMGSRKSLGKTIIEDHDNTINYVPKNLFNKGQPRNRPVFPAALLNSTNKTINKTLEPDGNERQGRNLFGQGATKRKKNMFTDFVLSESEDDSEIQHKVFGFKKNDNKRISLATRNKRMPSLTPSVTTEIDIDDWNLLPSSTMIGNGSGALDVSRITNNEEQMEIQNRDATLTEANESLKLEEDDCNTSESRNEQPLNRSRFSKSMKYDEEFDKTLTNENIVEEQISKNQDTKSSEASSINNISRASKKTMSPKSHKDKTLDMESSKVDRENSMSECLEKETTKRDGEDLTENKTSEHSRNEQTNNMAESKPSVEEKMTEMFRESINNEASDEDTENEGNLHKTCDNNDNQENVDENEDREINNDKNGLDDNNKTVTNNDTPIKDIPDKRQKIVESSVEEEEIVQENEVVEETPNSSYVTAGQNRKKDGSQVKDPEVVIQNISKGDMSFKPIGRSTSFRKSAIEDVNQRPTLVPIQENTIGSDGSRNSSTERSGWDSHRTTRKTLRQTFGKDFTPRKSLRTLVIEKSAKRQSEVEKNVSKVNTTKNKTVLVDQHVRDRRVSNRNLSSDQLPLSKSPALGASLHHVSDPLISKPQVSYHKSVHDINEPEISQEILNREESINVFDKVHNDSGPEISIHASYGSGMSGDTRQEIRDISVKKDHQRPANKSLTTKRPSVPVGIDALEEEELDYDPSLHDSSHKRDISKHSSAHIISTKNSESGAQDLTERENSESLSNQETEKEDSEPEASEQEMEVEESEQEMEADESEPELEAEESQQELELEESQTDIDAQVSEQEIVADESQQEIEDIDPQESDQEIEAEESQQELELEESQTDIDAQESEQEIVADESQQEIEDIDPQESDQESHDISADTQMSLVRIHMKKIAQENMEARLKIREQVQNSLKQIGRDRDRIMYLMQPKSTHLRMKKPEPVKPKKKSRKPTGLLGALPEDFIKDLSYKPPKRFKPANASWITKRLYKFLESKLEPKYDYRARVRAEQLVESIYEFTKLVRRRELAPPAAVDELKREMARLRIVSTHHEFYHFFHEFMPREIRVKVNPDIVNRIPMPRNGVFSDILQARPAVD